MRSGALRQSDVAPTVWPESRDRTKQRRFASARRPGKHHTLGVCQIEMFDVDDVPAVGELDIDVVEDDVLGASLGSYLRGPHASERLRLVDGCIERTETIDHGFEDRKINVVGDKNSLLTLTLVPNMA